ncbi:MAG: proline dehydrogenase family protein [Candidatus Pristimantibacillus sp.]
MDIGSEVYRKVLLTIAGNSVVEKLSIKHGKKLAMKFISSDNLQGALQEVQALNDKGIMATLDALGEGIKHLSEAEGYRDEYLRLIEGINKSGVNSNLSLKPTQMGLSLNAEQCYVNIRAVVSKANENNNFVRIDMENSPFTQATIDIVLRLHKEGLTNVGTVIQAYLFRTEQDVKYLIAHNVPLRLVKGAYKEPGNIAIQSKNEVIDNLKKIIRMHLDHGIYAAIASHDDTIVDWVKDYAKKNNISKHNFEFQMLYGLRMNDQAQLAKEGYRIRCYVPYGAMWYPYYTRRLAEKPANLMMVLRNMF